MSLPQAAARAGGGARLVTRAVLLAALLPLEIVILDFFYDMRATAGADAGALWLDVNQVVKFAAYAALYALGALILMLWPQRRALIGAWRAAAETHAWRFFAAFNLILFALLLAATFVLRGGGAPWLGFPLWLAGVALMAAAAAAALAPARFWRGLAAAQRLNLALALIAGLAVALAALLARDSWNALAGATLNTSYALLRLYEPGAVIDVGQRLIGANGFAVIIDALCSGYEGVGLVLASLGLYTWLFRGQLRFPNVLALFPIGALAIWLLNSVRIALLVSIGAHVSPDAALGGFHSQAGWLMFVGVTAGLMIAAHASPFFHARARASAKKDPALRLATALIAPFAALMAGRAFAVLFGPGAHWIAAGAIVLPAAALWLNRRALLALAAPLRAARMGEAALIGLLVGALWIATQAPAHEGAGLGAWLGAQSPAGGAAWLALRVLGFALIVPMAEELAFRGYLHRALTRRRFEEAGQGDFTWLAFVATSVLFGAMHGRWLAGALAGAAYALTLYRAKTIAAPITAHITSNALIAAYAIAFGADGLL
ncbi:MAG: exosortase E/protease, VPEID-CTERM system [Hyphomonadaceae bacterium]